MIRRELEKKVLYWSRKLPIVAVTGPRQSGKTTLVKALFRKHRYVSFEDPVLRDYASSDPKGFLNDYGLKLVIDEAQYVPRLFPYIQLLADEHRKSGMFILAGSQNFLLLNSISQSLAGRVAILNLLPFSVQELRGTAYEQKNAWEYIYKGFYPRIYSGRLSPKEWLPFYLESYIERDVRSVLNVADLNTFRQFILLCAGSIGQTLNMSRLGTDAGASYQTIKRWLSVLESSFIVYLLPPYHKNFRKRIVKSPKLYFYDTGLACSLLGIDSAGSLSVHWAKGALFENFILLELLKKRVNEGLRPSFYHWKNNLGREVDLLIEEGGKLKAVEIKASATASPEHLKGVEYFQELSGISPDQSCVVYGGAERFLRQKGTLIPWSETDSV